MLHELTSLRVKGTWGFLGDFSLRGQVCHLAQEQKFQMLGYLEKQPQQRVLCPLLPVAEVEGYLCKSIF